MPVPERGGWVSSTSCGMFVTLQAVTPSGAADLIGVLRYQQNDPFAVRLECHPPAQPSVSWLFARETLEAGLRGRAGCGHVVVSAGLGAERGRVFILLSNEESHCVLRGDAERFKGFLAASKQLVPYGQEHRHINLDALITSCSPAPEP